ncbi:MAG: CaiB/BaiF CoA transferase family protein [Acidimicrobiales bacterium]
MSGPLTGIRVVEAASVITGPWACSLLADQGAEVVKIEAPEGDIMRKSGHIRNGLGSWFVNLNRGKQSVVIDLTSDQGRALVHRMVAEADVFVENWRPGVAARLGLSYDELSEINPEIVHASVTGFGDTGPLSAARAYDPTVQGRSGIVAAQSNDDTNAPQPVRLAVTDQVTALTLSQAITAALLARATGSGGQHVELNMLAASVQFLWPVGMSDHTYIGPDTTPGVMYGPTLRFWPTLDGAVTAAIAPDKEWEALCRVSGKTAWSEDSRFATIGDRLRNYDALMTMVGEHVATLTTAECSDLFDRSDVPYSPAIARDGLWNDPQIDAIGIIEEVDHPTAGRMRQTTPAPSFTATPALAGTPAPSLGEHTDRVLTELGLASGEIASLRESGVVG